MLERQRRFPHPVDVVPLPTAVYIILAAFDGRGPYRAESYAEYCAAVRDPRSPGVFAARSVSRGFPSRSEASAYLFSAGHAQAPLPPRWQP